MGGPWRFRWRRLHAGPSRPKLARLFPGRVRVSELSHMLAGLIAHYGIPALFISVALETLGAPLPGESAIIVAAGAAAGGTLNIYAVALTAFLAAVVGDNAGYLIGRKLGRPVITRYGARFGMTERNFDRVEAVARKYGPLMVVFARFIPILRQLNGLVAGTTRMYWPVFVAANALGAALWVGTWTTLAYRFGGHAAQVVPYFWHHLNLVGAVGVMLLILALAWLRLRRRSPGDVPNG
jgi:membrane protein DedA with SNARE-associated domain